jgi:hypothetical protein
VLSTTGTPAASKTNRAIRRHGLRKADELSDFVFITLRI